MVWLYNIAISVYSLAIFLASFFNKKAKLWIEGRKGIFEQLEKQLQSSNQTAEVSSKDRENSTSNFQLPTSNHSIIWMHVASLGEFEQGRPIIEKLKDNYPEYKILLTFFSPSGYEIRKNYELADYVFYLPVDTKKNAKRFIENVDPKLVIFVKYEFWYHYLNTLETKGIPTILVSAIFRPSQLFFKSYGNLFKKILAGFEQIFVQNEASFQLLKSHNYQKTTLAGDTRIDRVADIATQSKSYEVIEKFAEGSKTLICGSTWPPDEAVLINFIKKSEDWKFVIAPHEVEENNILRLQKLLPENTVRYSKADLNTVKNAKILIIDNIGMLSSIYRYGKVAYIGGGFGKGIHNTLEPIAFRLPVVFGPKYKKFDEAVSLVEKGGSFSITDSQQFNEIMSQMDDENFYKKASQEAENYISENRGATEKIINYISTFL